MHHDLSSSISIDSGFELWLVDFGFLHVLAVFLLLQIIVQWLYSQLTMSDKSAAQSIPSYLQPVLGRTWRTIALGSPEDVIKTQFMAFDRDFLYDVLGDDKLHKTASDLFTSNALRDVMVSSVRSRVPVFLSELQRGMEASEPIDLAKLLNRFTMEVFAETGFGVDLGCLDSAEDHSFQKAFDTAQCILSQRFTRPAWLWKTMRWLNLGVDGELQTFLTSMSDLVLGIISESLKHRPASQNQTPPEETTPRVAGRNIVSMLLDSVSDVDGGEMEPSTLCGIVMSFLLAGQDSMSQAINWFFYVLSQHPHVEREIRDEIAAKIPELLAGEIAAPIMDQVSQLYYLEAAVVETLRLFPFAPANRDTSLYYDTRVSVSTYCMTRWEQVWDMDAKVFNPMRWIEPESGRLKPLSPSKFCVYGADSHCCMDMPISEMKIVASSILARYHLNLVPGQRVSYKPLITLALNNPLFVRVEPV